MRPVLVIDDDSALRRLMVDALRREGYALVAADNGDTGIELARQHLPLLVLCDVNMERTDGFAVLQQLRADPRTAATPVILMTGGTGKNNLRHGMELGADDYLPKPFELPQMLAAVRARVQRQEAMELLAQERETQLLEMLAATHDLVAIMDPDTGRLSHLNRAGQHLLGLGPDEDVSQIVLPDFCQEPSAAKFLSECLNLARQQGVWIGESILKRRDGKSLSFSLQLIAHRGADGKTAYLSVVARDISDLKRSETERRHMEVQLRQAHKLEAIGQLASGIAHEINTPTQYVGDNTRFLKDSLVDIVRVLQSHKELVTAAEQGVLTREMVATARKTIEATDLDFLLEQIPGALRESLEGLERITQIVRAMKDFSHPGGTEKVAADLNKAIESTLTVARNEWKYVADLKLELADQLPLVPCLLSDFNQALLNLIINAAHAIADVVAKNPGTKGLITVRTRAAGEWVEVQVSDTGAGIPESARARVFEPFFTTKPVGKGSGQGLTIVYGNIVKKHGGTVTFETSLNEGTTFCLRLPIRPSLPEAA